MIAILFALMVLLICFGWVYLIFRLVCRFFICFLIRDEVSQRALKYARLWGSSGAVLLSLSTMLFGMNTKAEVEFLSVILAPGVEEIAKGLAAVAGYFLLTNPSGRTLFVVGALSGCGFYLSETCIAILAAAVQGGETMGQELSIRAVSLSFMHPLSTAFTGLGLGLAASTSRWYLKCMFILLGYCFGCFIHMWNNLIAVTIDNGASLDQSAFLVVHLSIALSMLAVARLKIAAIKKKRKPVDDITYIDGVE